MSAFFKNVISLVRIGGFNKSADISKMDKNFFIFFFFFFFFSVSKGQLNFRKIVMKFQVNTITQKKVMQI